MYYGVSSGPQRDLAATFLRWTFLRALLHRGYWMVTSLYLVFDAGLSPSQLVVIGSAQGVVSVVFEIPTGVIADTISRKWSLVLAHLLVGLSMVLTGLVTAFPALVATQMLWGIAWTFASGADVAWITDELGGPSRATVVLAARARWQQLGAVAGMLGFGGLAWLLDRSTAMVVAGTAMALLGLYVALRFEELHFTPAHTQRWRQAGVILRHGIALARRDPELMAMLVATFLINGAADAFERLLPKRLVELGFPVQPDPVVWFTGLGVLTFLVGALALRAVETQIDGGDGARRVYAAVCGVGAVGLLVLAAATNAATGGAGVLLVSGIAWTVTSAVGTIWVNARATTEVRATVQSFLAQVEYLGEILCGVVLSALVQATSISSALVGACALVVGAAVVVYRRLEARGSTRG